MSQALTPEQELANRTWIKNRILLDYPDLPVMITPFYFSSKQDYIGQCFNALTEQTTSLADYEAKEASFAMIMWSRFVDSITESSGSCEDNPTVNTYYKIHLFKEFKDVRDNSTNSHDELVAMILKMRNRFLNNMDISPRITQFPLSCLDNLRRNQVSEFLQGVKGDFIDLQVRIESR